MIADPVGAIICLVTPVAVEAGRPGSGPFVWHHLVTTDQAKSGAFYSELLGWTRREVDAGPFGTYTIFQRDSDDVAGMMNPTIDYARSRQSSWYAYVTVDNVSACANRTVQLGGTIIEPLHDVPGFGRVCLIADPMGATHFGDACNRTSLNSAFYQPRLLRHGMRNHLVRMSIMILTR
jgi:uncharacterized protein